MSYALAIQYLHPDAEWSMIGNDLATLEWRSDGPAPTQAELDAVMDQAELQHNREVVDVKRRAAYTTEADPLYFKAQRGEVSEQVWLDKIAEIRARYPEPT